MATMPKINRTRVAVSQPVAASTVRPTTSASVVNLHEDDEVLCTIPKSFTLTDDDHKPHPYKPGTYNMPREHAMHWYAKANGVTVANIRNPNAG